MSECCVGQTGQTLIQLQRQQLYWRACVLRAKCVSSDAHIYPVEPFGWSSVLYRPGAPCEAGSLLAEASLWLLIQEARARGDERHAVKRAGKDPRAATKQPSDAGVVAYCSVHVCVCSSQQRGFQALADMDTTSYPDKQALEVGVGSPGFHTQ